MNNNNNSINNAANNVNGNVPTVTINPSLNPQERAIIIENIKKFLIEHLPPDQCNSPQKAHELAVRFENHVAMTSTTKEQYQGMIAEKLKMIKLKSTEPSPALSTNSVNSTAALSPQEIAQVTARLNQIRPQIPQIDKLLLLHSKLPSPPPSNTIELVKKLTECRNLLVSQVEIVSSGDVAKKPKSSGYLMNLGQLNLLIEQVQRLFNSLVTKMKESAGIKSAGSTGAAGISTANNVNSANSPVPTISSIPTTNTLSNSSSATISNNLLNSASSISSNSSISLSKSSKSKPPTSFSANDKYEKLLIQRLSLPPDNTNSSNTNNIALSYEMKLLQFKRRNFKLKTNNLKHLKQRNILLCKELECLRFKNIYKVRLQDDSQGTLNLLLTSQVRQFVFKIAQKYPFDELVYRVEDRQGKTTVLPKNKEPKCYPITVTNIINNYETLDVVDTGNVNTVDTVVNVDVNKH